MKTYEDHRKSIGKLMNNLSKKKEAVYFRFLCFFFLLNST